MIQAASRPITTRARVALAVTLAGAAVVTAPAAAEAGGPSTWQVPAECGGSPRLAAHVAVRAGRPLTGDEAIAVEVAITRGDGGYRAAIDVYSVRGAARREVAGADCAAVLDAVALVLAVALQEAPPVADEVDPGPPPREPSRFVVAVGAGMDQGALPATSPGATLLVAFGRGAWRLDVGGEIYQSAFAPAATDDPMGARVGVSVGLLGARLRGCRRWGPLRGCAGAAVGRLEGRPTGLFARSTESRRWSAVTAGVGWTQRFGGRFALTVDVDGLLALDRPEFVTMEDERLHQPAAGGVRVGAGLEVEIR